MIPKILHFIWVGNNCWSHSTDLGLLTDETKRPDDFIKTWKEKHPEWDIKIWGNDDLFNKTWHLKKQMYDLFYDKECYAGVADLMRYEILYEHGGIYMDCDTVCLRPLDDLLDCKVFVVSNRDKKLVANGFIGVVPKHPLFEWIISHLLARGDNCLLRQGKNGSVGTAIGPGLLTHAISQTKLDITILPYYTFMPNDPSYHHVPSEGQKIYGDHLWYGYY